MRRTPPLALAAALAGLVVATVPSAPAQAGDRGGQREVHPVARKATTLTLSGHGYGHGHGMSQYGAQGAALQGLTAQQIVGFYYPGTVLGTGTGKLRVLLTGDTSDDVEVLASNGLKVRDLTSRAVTVLPAGPTRFRLVADGAGTRVQALRKRWRTVLSVPGQAEFAGKGPLTLVTSSGTARYRGTLRSAWARGEGSSTRDTVNVLPLEKYLRGVVAREIPASWGAEAVRAQAIAARTYAAYERAHPASYYDICDTTSCQVYGGVGSENPLATEAIKATKGQVVSDGTGPAFTQFSASSGGWTAAGSVPYLAAQADPYDGWSGNPVHDWSLTLPVAKIEAAFPTIGRLTSIQVPQRDGNGDWGGRIVKAVLVGTNGKVTVSGDSLRAQFGLRSTWFTFG